MSAISMTGLTLSQPAWIGLCDVDVPEGEAPRDTLIPVLGILAVQRMTWSEPEIQLLTVHGLVTHGQPPIERKGEGVVASFRAPGLPRPMLSLGLYVDHRVDLGDVQARSVRSFALDCLAERDARGKR